MAATVLDDRESIRLLLRKINDAWVNGRTDELTEYFDADMVIVAPGFQGTERGRAACVNSYRDFVAQAKVHEYTESDATVDVWGDTGVATYRFHIVYDMGGATYRESGWDIFVLGEKPAPGGRCGERWSLPPSCFLRCSPSRGPAQTQSTPG